MISRLERAKKSALAVVHATRNIFDKLPNMYMFSTAHDEHMRTCISDAIPSTCSNDTLAAGHTAVGVRRSAPWCVGRQSRGPSFARTCAHIHGTTRTDMNTISHAEGACDGGGGRCVAMLVHGVRQPVGGAEVGGAEVGGALRVDNTWALGRQDGPRGSWGGEDTGRGPVRPGEADAAWRRVVRRASHEHRPLLRVAGQNVQEAPT